MKKEIKTPQQILQEAQEEFENNCILGDIHGGFLNRYSKLRKDKVWDWHTATLQSFIEAEIAREEAEKMLDKFTEDFPDDNFARSTVRAWREKQIGYNQAKNDSIVHLKELLTKI